MTTKLKPRKVILTIECETTLPHKELLGLQSLVFGRVRRADMNDRESRCTIKHSMPRWAGHDVRGIIKQVQANVIEGRPSRNGTAPKARAKKRSKK